MGRVPVLALTGAEQPFGGLESIMHRSEAEYGNRLGLRGRQHQSMI